MAELLDQLEVTAALVSAEGGAAGHIADIMYWYEGLANWMHLDPANPPSAPQDTELHLAVYWVNDGNAPISGHVDLTITRPDSTTVSPEDVLNQDQSAPPGSGWGVQFAPVTLDQMGSYQARATLSGEQA